jgi:hypothetical protein
MAQGPRIQRMRRPEPKPTTNAASARKAKIWLCVEAELVQGNPATHLDLAAAVEEAIDRLHLAVLRSGTAGRSGGWSQYRLRAEVITTARPV